VRGRLTSRGMTGATPETMFRSRWCAPRFWPPAPITRNPAAAALLPGKLGPIPAEPKPQLLARVNVASGKREENELYNAIPRRHTNRGPYDPRKAISPDFVEALKHLPGDYPDVKLFLFTAEADRKKIAEISSVANTEIYSDPDVQHGSERWIRTKWSSVQKYRDGLTRQPTFVFYMGYPKLSAHASPRRPVQEGDCALVVIHFPKQGRVPFKKARSPLRDKAEAISHNRVSGSLPVGRRTTRNLIGQHYRTTDVRAMGWPMCCSPRLRGRSAVSKLLNGKTS
jgi:hypothetical protein